MYAFLAIELFTRIYIYGILPEPEFNLTEGIVNRLHNNNQEVTFSQLMNLPDFFYLTRYPSEAKMLFHTLKNRCFVVCQK
jgi:hypothetical protein